MNVIERLKVLYAAGNKHDNYQNLPLFVQERLGFNVQIDENWRGDTARFNFFEKELNFQRGETVIDVGANTGFFTLSLAHRFPEAKFIACEMNPDHVDFIREIATHFDMNNVDAATVAVDMGSIKEIPASDYVLHFNVLHHAGVDFDKGQVEGEKDFFGYATSYLQALRQKTNNIVFQMGYNWGGNKLKPIVPLQDDLAKLTYTLKLFLYSGWSVDEVALCSRENGVLTYHKIPAGVRNNLFAVSENGGEADEATTQYLAGLSLEKLSEFYRRPIFTVSNKNEK
jgi:hypothetical protein